ncbi:MAG: 23S rRNA (pseudouridine(1915)-N(3))-methyltransferase RlmH [Acetatifactor sp.]|nr:23S rRNA (pseudouridine(1915)-N(3))-methyltransferase RlmH [Acetatifactor sp.]
MKITVICVGKIKEKFYRDAIAEYEKRLTKYCKPDFVEVADEKTPDGAGEALEEQIKAREGARILEKIKPDAYVCTLEIGGKKMSSEGMADWMEKLCVSGTSHITFVIGGSLGLHPSVSKRADLALSFSDMTFPHQLMRVILAEQIYRCFRIINREPYHK